MISSAPPRGATLATRLRGLLGNKNVARGILGAGLAVYAAGFLAFPPRVISVRDEVAYIRQAAAFATGEATVVEKDALTGSARRVPASTYPPGTSALQALFIRLGGWRWAAAASLVSLAATVLLLAKWLTHEGRSPLFALLVLGYPPTLALSRLAMSDMPSATVVTLGLLLFWRGLDGPAAWWVASGFAAGVSLLFREANALLFAPLFAGALLRRERKALALMAGLAAAIPLRLLSSTLLFASPFFHRPPAGFRWGAIPQNAPLYLLALLAMVPGGLAAGLLYRGRRRGEIVATTALCFLFYLSYDYGGELSAGLKRVVVAPRYFIPFLPVLAFASAEALPRLWARWTERLSPPSRRRLEGATAAAVGVWVLGVLAAAAAVHTVMDAWGRSQLPIVRAIYEHTREGAAVVTNPIATAKYMNALYGERVTIPLFEVRAEEVPRILRAHGSVQLVFLDRFDAEVFSSLAGLAGENLQFVQRTGAHCRLELLYDRVYGSTGRLRIWDVAACRPP